MEIKSIHWVGIILALIIVGSSFLLIGNKFFFLVIGIGFIVGILPFVFSLIYETRAASEKEEMFLEFARNLVESVKTGTPISRSIMNLRSKSFGVLGENIEKLANQIYLGIPLNIAFQTFARDVNNKTVSRAITLIGQAEKAGGDIGEILESVAGAVSMSDKLKKERKATISTLVVQGYIIFVVFLVIVLVMQFKILPMVSGIAEIGVIGGATTGGGIPESSIGTGTTIGQEDVSSAFLYLLLIQGFFSGLIIGKLSEGNVKAGIRHSFFLMLMSFIVSAGANVFLT
ncbi:MAG: type II secretion system F family protein [archaeon]